MKTSPMLAAPALAATALMTLFVVPARAAPDKQTDRAGWIKASMDGRQAAFCGPVKPKDLSGGADPDFVANQVKKQWEGVKLSEVSLGDALPLATALCKFPGNADLQAALSPLWQGFVKFYGFGAADLADFAAVQDPGQATLPLETRAPKDARLADGDALTQALVAKSLLVTSYGMDFMSYAELLDTTPTTSEHLKAAFVEQCVDSYHGSIARWAICKDDALSLDRKRFDRELATAKIDARHRLEDKVRFVKLQQAVKLRADQYAAEAAKDGGVAKVIDAIPASAAKTWEDDRGPHQALLAWTYKLVDDARANNKKLMDGCEAELRTHLATYLGAKKPATSNDLKNVFRDDIGSQLGNAAALCFVRNEAAQKFWSDWSSGFAQRWGRRTMIWHALVSEKIDFDTNRGNDPLGLPRPVITYANASTSGSSGTIATMQESDTGFAITFKKESWKEPVCKQWKETNKIDGIDPQSGKLIYRTVCTKSGMETRTNTPTPVTVDKAYATGLKIGVASSFVRNSDGSAYPVAIYSDKKRTKLVGAFGISF
ncbi:MAG: hypothetical protein IPQ07_24065 [Myxococcales bacterium]|nr:hypothetical protein [Myxococcales bacterium]